MIMHLNKHLQDRFLDLSLYSGVSVDPDEGVVVFPLWNLSGQMVGYQQYRPFADKKAKNHPKDGRYTFLSGDKKNKQMGVWGLETYHFRSDILVITEGVFDACRLHNYGIPCIALLNSSYKHYRNWLTCMGRKIYKVEDGHGSGLGPYDKIGIPDHRNDLGDCTEDEIKRMLKGVL